MPCGACREFFLQLALENRDMEILADYETRETVTLNSTPEQLSTQKPVKIWPFSLSRAHTTWWA